jgi:acyl-CoA dehydrogenase
MASHPFIRDEFYAVRKNDKIQFRKLIWQHIKYYAHNKAQAILSAWTGGLFISVPNGELKRECQRLSRLSHAFAWLADFALIYLGGNLKRKERLSARLADGMSYLYMAMATIGYFQEHSEHAEQKIHAQWALQYCFYHAQKSMIAFCRNLPSRFLGSIIRFMIFPCGQSMLYPSDKLDHKLVKLMTTNNDYRNNLLKAVYLSGDSRQPVDKMENALQLIIKNRDLYEKISDLKRYHGQELVEKIKEKVKAGELSQIEMDTIISVEQARWDAIQVDEFSQDAMKNKSFMSIIDDIKTPFTD